MEGQLMPVTAWAQLGAMVSRNFLLKKREWKKTLAVSRQLAFNSRTRVPSETT